MQTFNWNDKYVLQFVKLIEKKPDFFKDKTLNQKIKTFKMLKSKLLSENTAQVTVNDMIKYNNFSASFHINKLKNKLPYILNHGKYVPANNNQLKKAEYLNDIQLKQINNLLNAICEINREIERIKKSECLNESVAESKLSNRAKNTCEKITKKKDVMLSDIAIIPVSEWSKSMGSGKKTLEEIKRYLTNNGFVLIEE